MNAVTVNSDFVNELQDAMMQKIGENKEKLTTAYLKCMKSIMTKKHQQNPFRRNHSVYL